MEETGENSAEESESLYVGSSALSISAPILSTAVVLAGTTRTRSKVERVAQFGPRPQDKTSINAPIAQYLLSSYVAVTYPLVVDAVNLCLSA